MNILDKLQTRLGPLGDHAHYAHGYYAYPRLEGEISNKMIFNGKEKLVWSLNNYLGLANHPEVRAADREGARRYGLAYPMGARMMSGNTELHESFEAEIADYVCKEDAFLLNYGYQGMVSIIDSLVDRNDVIVYDAESHACILDGARLHMGQRFVFKHNDIEDCEKQILRAQKITQKTKGAILVITEGVFGMRGDQGKLKEIIALKENYSFSLLVDDAHGIGCMGKTGAGTGEEQGIQKGIDFYFGTFAKSFAGIGAFIASTKEGNTNSPITPIYLNGTIEEATALVSDLRENHNIFCSMVVYPVVPKGMIILRLIPTAEHSLEDVKRTITAFSGIRSKLLDGYYKQEIETMI